MNIQIYIKSLLIEKIFLSSELETRKLIIKVKPFVCMHVFKFYTTPNNV
jgi:hypothetical protein